jgi:hypothetical protein
VAKQMPKSLSAFSLLRARWAPPRKSNGPLSRIPTSLFVGEQHSRLGHSSSLSFKIILLMVGLFHPSQISFQSFLFT